MHIRGISPPNEFVQPLEPRRLLSFTALGREARVTFDAQEPVVDVAVANDGSSIFVTELRHGELRRVTAFRYSGAGDPVGRPITLYTYVQAGPAALVAGFRRDGRRRRRRRRLRRR